jgi:large subunit ribosomal protein L4
LNKKVKVLARKSAFSVKAQSDSISVLEVFTFDTPKTKSYLNVLNALSLVNTKTLLILPSIDNNVYLSSRNVPKAKVTTVDAVNTYDLMYADRLLISESALSILETQLNK